MHLTASTLAQSTWRRSWTSPCKATSASDNLDGFSDAATGQKLEAELIAAGHKDAKVFIYTIAMPS